MQVWQLQEPITTITILSELYFRFRGFILLVQTKLFLWAMTAAQVAENHGDEWGLTWYFWWDIYINTNLNLLTKFTTSSKSTKFKNILTLNISQMYTNTVPINTRIAIGYAMKWGIPFWFWWKVHGKRGNKIIKICQWRESHCRTKLASKTAKESQSGIQIGKLKSQRQIWDILQGVNSLGF